MPTMFEDIKAFHEKFALTYNGPPRVLDEELGKFRAGFLAEELAEYAMPDDLHDGFVDAVKAEFEPTRKSLEDQFDALIDLVYVALGTAYLHGFDFEEGWRRVHEANMKKIRVERVIDSKRGSVYDVIKPDGWLPPSLADLVGR